ncbi:6-phosphogluconolactonase [Hyphomonas sp.]|uniref:6-phosphogluconolactonase n=1 Tax=Hyphomonas sp. TaxID=87 RepID=UPI00391D58A7
MAATRIILDDREDASEVAAKLAVAALSRAIAARGSASFMASGGSTPGLMYSMMSEADVDWANVTAGLVDERWVAPDHPDSNEKLLRATLLKSRAAEAKFLPMKTDAATPAEASAERSAAYAPACGPVSCIVLGMGSDGHTASWFPGSRGLTEALRPDAPVISAIDASNSPLAGTNPLRMTLTSGPVCAAEAGILLVFGDDKRAVLEAAFTGDPQTFPVRHAMDGLGDRLTIIWAP